MAADSITGKKLEYYMGCSNLKRLFILLVLALLIGSVHGAETPAWDAPYGAGRGYKNGSWVDDFSVNPGASGVGPYNNLSDNKWNVSGGGKITSPTWIGTGISRVYRNESFNSSRIYACSGLMDGSDHQALIRFADQSADAQDTTGAGTTYAAYLYLYPSGARTELALFVAAGWTDLGGTDLTNTPVSGPCYFMDVMFNNSAGITINYTQGLQVQTTRTSTNTVLKGGYVGTTASSEGVFWDNLSIEMPPGERNYRGGDGVNWTNTTGFPYTGISSGTIAFNDTTAINHTSISIHSNRAHWTYDNWTWDVWNSTTNLTPTANFGPRNVTLSANSMTGKYWVKLTVNNTYGGNSTAKQDFISVGAAAAAPVADFSCSPLAMVRMNKTNCDDLSTNTPTSWLWYGADGCVVNSTSENPVLQFGNYSYCKTLCLMATNAGGSDTECKSNYIYVSQPWAWF